MRLGLIVAKQPPTDKDIGSLIALFTTTHRSYPDDHKNDDHDVVVVGIVVVIVFVDVEVVVDVVTIKVMINDCG